MRVSERNAGSPCFPKEDEEPDQFNGTGIYSREEIRHELEPMQLHFGNEAEEDDDDDGESETQDPHDGIDKSDT